MNASLPTIQPAAASPSQAAPAAQDETGQSAFREVLSGEIAQRGANTSDSEAADASEPPASAAAASSPGTQDTDTTEPAADIPLDPAMAALSDAMLALARQLDPAQTAGETAPATPDAAMPADTVSTDVAVTRAQVPGEQPVPLAAPVAASTAPTTTVPAATARPADSVRMDGRASAAPTDDVAATANTAAPNTPTAAAPATIVPDRLPDFAATLAAAQTTQVATAAAAPLATSERLTPQVGTAAWNQALGDRIVWMAAGAQQSASLSLNPPDLGPLQVVLKVTNDQASASFFAAQPEVRQALEAALPRLREMMQDAGIQLGQASVGADTASQQYPRGHSPQRAAPAFDHSADHDTAPLMPMPPRTGRGLVDTFA